MTLSNTYLSRKQLLADNLNSMGVSSVDANDGLTTLINAVLDIEPSIGGLDLDTAVNITANPSTIIVGQSVILTSKLTASYDDETVVDVDLTGVLTGATIQYKEGNTVLGTGITDNTGVATCTVSGLTLGTHTVKAVFQGTENFNDCESNNITITVNNPEPASITLAKTDGKQILSYVDSAGGEEFCELTATVVDSNNSPVPGVNVTLYKDGTVWDTVATDVNGEVTKIYNSAGVGDVGFTAECGSLVSETYDICDAWDYDSLTSNNNKFSITSGGADVVYDSTGLDITGNQNVDTMYSYQGNLPSTFSIEFEFVSSNLQSSGQRTYSTEFYCNGVELGANYSGGIFYGNGGSLTYTHVSFSAGDLVRLDYDGSTVKMYRNNNLIVSLNKGSNTNVGFKTYNTRNLKVKNMKILPL